MPTNPLYGFTPVYRPHETNRCPGCARSHWIVGRLLVECAFCGTALPIEGAAASSTMFRVRTSQDRIAA